MIRYEHCDFNYKCKNEIGDNNEKMYSRLSDTVSHKIDHTAFGFHIDQPLAWELENFLMLGLVYQVINLRK